MTELKKVNSSSITEQCYKYMQENNVKKLNIYDFLDYIRPELDLTDEEFTNQMAYFYTDLNLDGRFVCIEDGSWVLKDTLSVEDVISFTEPSINKFDIDEDVDLDLDIFEEDEDITDELDELIEDEDDSDDDDSDDLYGFGDEEIVSKFVINPEEEEF